MQSCSRHGQLLTDLSVKSRAAEVEESLNGRAIHRAVSIIIEALFQAALPLISTHPAETAQTTNPLLPIVCAETAARTL
jgi:hypothetical protein